MHYGGDGRGVARISSVLSHSLAKNRMLCIPKIRLAVNQVSSFRIVSETPWTATSIF
jgi:hypothetical protein